MDQFPCPTCSKEFIDINSFSSHFKLAHQSCKKIVCKVENCCRHFDQYYSYRKHLNLSHHVPYVAPFKPPAGMVDGTLSEADNNLLSCDKDLSCDLDQASQCSDVPSDLETTNVNFVDLLVQEQDQLVAKIYANPAFPRNFVNTMIADFRNYLSSPFFDKMESVVTSSLDPNLSSNIKQDIKSMFKVLKNPFSHLETEYKRFAYFQSSGDYIPPIPFDIDWVQKRVKTKNGSTLEMKPVVGQYIPLDKLLTRFFQLPNVLEDTLAYMTALKNDNDLISNLVQCNVWKRKCARYSDNDIVIPLNAYYDEVEPNDGLGPHCEPLGCTYIHVAVLPPEWSSRLENIFLAVLFDADNRTLYGNRKAFKPFIEELRKLEEEGIIFSHSVLGEVKLYFVVASILGDNKGLNSVTGFVESFSANHYCRICKCTKEQAREMFVEDASLLRTPENYQEAVQMNDSQSTGIKEECIFNQLPSFVAPSDISIDEFHDLVEGVAHYSMIPILKHFHYLNNMFISTLNNRMYFIDLGPDSDNRPPLINLDRLLHKEKLKMTGSEMLIFVRIFGILVYDLIPKDDPFYELYLLLNDITSILQAKQLPKSMAKVLSLKVKEHHMLYVNLTKEVLKPKHHFLTHYPSLLESFGPFNLLSTIRFEAKHRLLSLTANTCFSRVNLPATVAIKQQLSFCYRSVSNSSLRQDMSYGHSHLVNLKEMDMYRSFYLSLPTDIVNESTVTIVNWVTYRGTTYRAKQVVVFDVDNDRLFEFAEIEAIIITATRPVFLCSYLKTLGYFSEIRGYEVQRLSEVSNWFAIDPVHLLDYNPLCMYRMVSGEYVVVLKYVL